jgi:hypothetical protein
MKKAILVMAVAAVLTSCKKKSEEIIPEKLAADIELVVKGTTREKLPLYPSSDTYNFLGFGYDATDQFNDLGSVRASVVDVTTYAGSGSYRVNIIRGTEGSWKTIQAENAVDLAEKFSRSFKETMGQRLFGNTLAQIFPETSVTDNKYVYGYYSNYFIWKRYVFNYEQAVNNFVTTGFKRDIALLSAQELVHKYGTHVLTGIEMGSKFDVVYQAEATGGNRQAIIMEGLRYALKRTFGLATGYLDEPNLRNLNANSSAQLYYNAIGGDMNQLKIQTINNRLMLNITDWRLSTTEDRAQFVGVYDHGLLPLDRFIDDSAKKAEVKSYLEAYFASKSVKLTN